MTKSHTLFSLLKSLWLRSTGQPGWCTCIICRDEMLNAPDPLGFSEDARELQKRLRKMPKAYKCKRRKRNRSLHHTNEETQTSDVSQGERTHIGPHANTPLPQPPAEQKVTKTVSFSEPLEQHHFSARESTPSSSEGYTYIHNYAMLTTNCLDKNLSSVSQEWIRKEENEEKKRLKVIRMLETIAEIPTSSDHTAEETHEERDLNDGYSFYEAHPPLKPKTPVFFHPDVDSMDSYGTITSEEILEAFEKASEELALESFTSLDSAPRASAEDDCYYMDLVHSSSIESTYV